MISLHDITQWGIDHPWSSQDQIEQDLLLSQAICEIANDRLLGNELVLRGGTAFHKLFLDEAFRYSEDLDYVRTTAGGIGGIMKRLTDLGQELGYRVNTKMGMYPKVLWKFPFASGGSGKIKIEINTFERSPMLLLSTRPHRITSPYFSGQADVPTFEAAELVATKIRALYQRSKGRDLFDLWLALDALKLSPDSILEAFPAYRPENVSGTDMVENLELKLEDAQFCHDLDNLIRLGTPPYDPRKAGALVIEKLLGRID